MRPIIYWLSTCLLCYSSAVLADTTLKEAISGVGNIDASVTYIKGDRVRVDTGTNGTYMLYNSATNTMTLVNPARKSYMVLDEAAMQAMSSGLAKARQRMQAMMAKMPPEQRRRMRQMMGERFGAMMGRDKSQPAPEVIRTGKTKTVNGFSCQVYTISGPGRDSYCVASFEETGIPEDDYQTLQDMMAFSASMAKQFAGFVGAGLGERAQAMIEINGIPIISHTNVANIRSESTLKSVSTETLDASLFTIPEGYTQKQMPTMHGR